MLRRLLEVCVDSLESFVNAFEGGADRVELCAALELGGLTPSIGLLLAAKAYTYKHKRAMPIFCMLRCRGGNFVYDENEIIVMLHDLDQLRKAGADGFVFGALTADGDIAEEQCCQVVRSVQGLPVTFHRAFDVCADWRRSLRTVEACGFTRILTSGQMPTAEEGIDALKDMVQEVCDYKSPDTTSPIRGYQTVCLQTCHTVRQVTILVGSGVRIGNIEHLMNETNALEYHSSASERRVVHTAGGSTPTIRMGAQDTHESRQVTVTHVVADLANAIHSHAADTSPAAVVI